MTGRATQTALLLLFLLLLLLTRAQVDKNDGSGEKVLMKSRRIDGATTLDLREAAIKEFNSPTSGECWCVDATWPHSTGRSDGQRAGHARALWQIGSVATSAQTRWHVLLPRQRRRATHLRHPATCSSHLL